MFDGIIDVAVKQDLTEDFKKSLEELKNKMVCIGIPAEKDAVRTANGKGRITNAQLLYIHTHGIRDNTMIKEMQHDINRKKPYSQAYELYVTEHGSPLFKIPPRPVLIPSMENSKESIAEQMKLALQSVLDGNSPVNELHKIGMMGQTIAQEWFRNPQNKWGANSPLTVKKKGSDRPLIDIGMLRGKIQYVLRNKGE